MRNDRTPSDPVHPSVPVASRSATVSTARVVRSIQRSRTERRTVFLVIGTVVSIWLLVVFANALADASEQAARLAQESAVNASLQARVDAGAVEIGTISGGGFQDFLARTYGIGAPGERRFDLAPGAPPPPVLTPLGHEVTTASATTPLEDWLDLLIGS